METQIRFHMQKAVYIEQLTRGSMYGGQTGQKKKKNVACFQVNDGQNQTNAEAVA